MIEKIQFTASLPERGIDAIEGYYSIEGTKAHLYLPANPDIPSFISHLDCVETRRKIHCQFINCRINGVGNDVYEHLAETAILGENISSYKDNKYKKVEFKLSNDILAFLNPPWDFMNSFFDRSSKQIKFTPAEERERKLTINENVQLALRTGYTQSYSNVRYKITSSAVFEFKFNNAVTREIIYSLTESVADYYSLFCEKPLTIESMVLITQEDIVVEYHGDKLTTGPQGEFFANHLIDENDVKNHLDHLTDWVNGYPKNQIALNLIRNASKISDEQLRFICFVRCLEVFHKENILTTSNPPRSFYEDLHSCAVQTGMADTDLPLNKFVTKEIKLIHRILDLIRSVYDLIIKERLLFGFLTGLNRAQEIVDTRNYFIHFSDSKKNKAIKNDQLPYRNYELLLFIRVVILHHFGFDNRTIQSLIGASHRRLFG